ncbi:sigma-54-dependent Fis family transcriptional regulator [Xanthobacteraceae bacterium A53D]
MEQFAIRAAWERFLADGSNPAGIPRALAASWQRSRAKGITIDLREAPLAGEAEIFRRRSANAALLHAARPALERSRQLLAEAASILIVTDASGFIIETAGDPRVVDHGRRNHLQLGGLWDESVIGTNAIGTALVEGRPTEIRGAAHFCADVQRWTCAATPIRDPLSGALLGVVDISGPSDSFNPQSLALAVSIGQEAEGMFRHAARTEHEALLRFFLTKRSIWLSEDMLVIDRRGIVVHASEGAQRRWETAPGALAGPCADPPLDEDGWLATCRRLFPQANVEAVRRDGVAIGALVVMHRSRSAKAGLPPSRASVEREIGFAEILGNSPVMAEVRSRAQKFAANDLPILIEGETGVGKELFARAIMGASPKAGGPFVPLNCGGIPKDLIASELFGYAKGAFTGADANGRAGRIEQANGGVLCLDEIGEMPLDLQSYLLRVLEDGVVYRIGDAVGRRVDMRIVSMTNRDLAAEVETGRFRRDLYYRIAAARIRIPPLRARGADVALLAQRFATAAARRKGGPTPDLAPEVLECLARHGWPGNVRELRNVIDAMVALSDDGRIGLADLPAELLEGTVSWRGEEAAPSPAVPSPAPPSTALASDDALKAAERTTILAQVEACEGNLTKAARRLGIARSTLYVRLAAYRAAGRGRH